MAKNESGSDGDRTELIELTYRLCDVFTEKQFQGNQLAVFEDAGGLTTEEMQRLANETNLSETTFVIRREAAVERREGVRVRIFTTQEELPFAGHPVLGTAATIRRFVPGYEGAEEIVLDLDAGKVPVRFEATHGESYGVFTRPEAVFGMVHDRGLAARALGFAESDLLDGYAPQTVSLGLEQCVVLLRSVEVLGRLQIPQREATAYLATMGARFFYCLAPATGGEADWRARMQFYNGEDPATGSAAASAIAYLVQQGLAESGKTVHLRQGVEIGRSSDLYASARRTSTGVGEICVGGSTVPVAKGHVFLKRFTSFQQA